MWTLFLFTTRKLVSYSVPWFWTGVTAPCCLQSRLSGEATPAVRGCCKALVGELRVALARPVYWARSSAVIVENWVGRLLIGFRESRMRDYSCHQILKLCFIKKKVAIGKVQSYYIVSGISWNQFKHIDYWGCFYCGECLNIVRLVCLGDVALIF